MITLLLTIVSLFIILPLTLHFYSLNNYNTQNDTNKEIIRFEKKYKLAAFPPKRKDFNEWANQLPSNFP